MMKQRPPNGATLSWLLDDKREMENFILVGNKLVILIMISDYKVNKETTRDDSRSAFVTTTWEVSVDYT